MSTANTTTKTALLTEHLQRPKGATLAELQKATGWQSHSIRAALTGLRKKGLIVERTKRDEITCYHIVEATS